MNQKMLAATMVLGLMVTGASTAETFVLESSLPPIRL